MKKLIYYIAMSILCILPYSCSLDEEARSEMEKKNYMTNAKEAQDVLLVVQLLKMLHTGIIYLSCSTWEQIYLKEKVPI